MRRVVIWLLSGVASVSLTMLVFFPAAWLASLVETRTEGRLTLGDAHGTLWQGSAFIGGSAGGSGAVTPLLPGRFSWRLSPLVLLGWFDAELENTEALSHPISVEGGWHEWKVSPGTLQLPAERLAALGAPLNTVLPSGQMLLSWETLQLTQQKGIFGVTGSMNLEIIDMASRLSPVKPMGSYALTFDWQGMQASVMLKTVKGPVLLSGSGTFSNGQLQFSGKAEADASQEEKLENFLNLLGQRRKEGNKDVIALEFK